MYNQAGGGEMPVKTSDYKRLVADPEKVRRAIEKSRREMGLPPLDQAVRVTHDELREMMLREGVQPEDNILSTEILKMRYPDDE